MLLMHECFLFEFAKRSTLKSAFVTLFFFIPFHSPSQKVYPQNYFSSPLTIPLILSGNFGEIRGSHFHSGLDFKTNNKEGAAVVAAADGYVYRIKVTEGGFGKVLYLKHENGYSTVYAHLHSFAKEIADTVISEQYSKKKFEIEIFPERDLFFFKKGDTIGLSGNSGGSAGPHLHFEIRHAEEDIPINPLLFGLNVPDLLPPVLQNIFIYKPQYGSVPVKIHLKTLDSLNYFTDERIEATSPFYVGFSADDYAVTDSNKLGIYHTLLIAGADTIYSYTFNSFAFDQTKYVSAHVDTYHKFLTDEITEICKVLPNNKLPVYPKRYNGNIFFKDRISCKLLLTDYNGKSCSVNFVVNEVKDSITSVALHSCNLPMELKGRDFFLQIPSEGFYQDVHLNKPYKNRQKIKNVIGDVFEFSEVPIPLSKPATLSIFKPKVSARLRNKLCIVAVDKKNALTYIGGQYDNGMVTSKINKIERLAVAIDTLPPIISNAFSIFTDSITMQTRIMIKVSDNISGIRDYNAFVNNTWELMEFEPKKAAFFITVASSGYQQKTILRVEATDRRNNKSEQEISIE